MCGIAGFASIENHLNLDPSHLVLKMTNLLRHRGPDAVGHWCSSANNIALGHRRLSIQDLSENGKQPMFSKTGRFVMVFNGEIYNHLQLRPLLKSQNWVGHSDTETILAAFEEWGFEKSLKEFIGMFSIAVWDNKDRKLILARDRIGEKPLYYGIYKETLVFASELKSIREFSKEGFEIDNDSVNLYFQYGYIPAPYSIYKNIKKLMPGSYIEYSIDNSYEKLTPKYYWSLSGAYNFGTRNRFKGSFDEAKLVLKSKLEESVSLQTISDLEVGAFLSGGIDSSLIVSCLQSQLSKPLKTFTVGFKDSKYNEAPYAKLIAEYLGTDHNELYVDVSDLTSVVDNLKCIYDEPFGDSSQLPTLLISSLIKKHVTVVLSGDGGDEFFYGYRHSQQASRFYKIFYNLPSVYKKLLFSSFNSRTMNSYTNFLDKIFTFNRPINQKFALIKSALADDLGIMFYKKFLSQWPFATTLVGSKNSSDYCLYSQVDYSSIPTVDERMMCFDACQYLPDDILVKVDRASMHYGLETRVPFLDHRVVEFSTTLPLDWKINNGVGKYILRELLSDYLPNDLFDRPKKGFSAPVDIWLRNSLRDWAESLMNKKNIENQGFVDYNSIKLRWDQHLSGKYNWRDPLWIFLMFQSWLDNN